MERGRAPSNWARRIRVVQTPFQAPNANAYAERFVRSIKHECLNRVIPLGARHLRHTISEFVEHYHRERFADINVLGTYSTTTVVRRDAIRSIYSDARLGDGTLRAAASASAPSGDEFIAGLGLCSLFFHSPTIKHGTLPSRRVVYHYRTRSQFSPGCVAPNAAPIDPPNRLPDQAPSTVALATLEPPPTCSCCNPSEMAPGTAPITAPHLTRFHAQVLRESNPRLISIRINVATGMDTEAV